MEDVASADCIVIYECDLRQEAPMMLLAVRQAWRKGSPVFLVGKGAPLEQAVAVSVEAVDLDIIVEAPIGIFDRPVIIFSTMRSSAAEIKNLMAAEAKFAPLFDGPNGMGLAKLAAANSTISLESAVKSGLIKGIITVESVIADEIRGGIPIIAALDWHMNSSVENAGVFLPTTAWVEMDGTFVNNEGRTQQFKKVMAPGIPLSTALESGHPPRIHNLEVPGGEPKPAWEVITEIMKRL
jgi:NADH-quinone oxidoreductase subunit G